MYNKLLTWKVLCSSLSIDPSDCKDMLLNRDPRFNFLMSYRRLQQLGVAGWCGASPFISCSSNMNCLKGSDLNKDQVWAPLVFLYTQIYNMIQYQIFIVKFCFLVYLIWEELYRIYYFFKFDKHNFNMTRQTLGLK